MSRPRRSRSASPSSRARARSIPSTLLDPEFGLWYKLDSCGWRQTMTDANDSPSALVERAAAAARNAASNSQGIFLLLGGLYLVILAAGLLTVGPRVGGVPSIFDLWAWVPLLSAALIAAGVVWSRRQAQLWVRPADPEILRSPVVRKRFWGMLLLSVCLGAVLGFVFRRRGEVLEMGAS